MLKQGANESDKVTILKRAAEGKTAAQIGKELMIEPKIVAKFMPPKPKAEPEKKADATSKK